MLFSYTKLNKQHLGYMFRYRGKYVCCSQDPEAILLLCLPRNDVSYGFCGKIKAEVRMDWETSNELKSCSCSVHCYWGPWIISDKETVKIERIQHFRRNVKTSPQKEGGSRCCQGLKVNLQSKHTYFFHLFCKKGNQAWLTRLTWLPSSYKRLFLKERLDSSWTQCSNKAHFTAGINGKTYLSKKVIFIYLLLKSCIMDLIWSIWQSNLVNLQICCCTEHFQT